jgi:murein DD-endopeptidase MepM/ murein hydrolase activator NlpD
MSMRRARAIAYGVVALLGVAAVLLTRPLPPGANTPAAEVLSAEHEAHLWREQHDTVRNNESLAKVLARGGLSDLVIRNALSAAKSLDPRRIPVGMPLVVRTKQPDTVPNEIILKLAVDKLLHLTRTDSVWSVAEENLPWKTDTVAVSGVVKTNLYQAMDSGNALELLGPGARRDLTGNLAEIYEFRVDMSRDLQVGDSFQLLTERRVGPNGIIRMGKIIAASMKLSGVLIQAVPFKSAKVGGDFFDQNGRSMRTGFLRTPVDFRRISSGFGLRMHPILGTMRKHQGLDYAADAGTPVRAIGDGVVIHAGWSNGYGNEVEVRHPNGFVSRYGHMRRLYVHGGQRVSQKQTIGEVGSTGLSTGPHLHFEVLVNGSSRDPRKVLANASSDPIPTVERVAFESARNQALALLNSPRMLASAESAGVRQAGSKAQ